MKLTQLLTHESGWLEHLADLADPDMVDEARLLFAEVWRGRVIEDAAKQCRRVLNNVTDYHQVRKVDACEAIDDLIGVLEANPRPDDAAGEVVAVAVNERAA